MFKEKCCECNWMGWCFILLLIISTLPVSIHAQNMALNKSYILSTNPNYPHSAPSLDKTSLTDGVYTKDKFFWNQSTTVGWQSKEVSVTLDLGETVPISQVNIHTFRSINSGVYFPQNLFVFLSTDKRRYKYLGDAADVLDNRPGTLQFKKFGLNSINEFARYVTVVIIPHGYFIFCDEIEILKSNGNNITGIQSIEKESLKQYVDSLKTPKYSKRVLASINDKLLTDKNQEQILEINSELKKSSTSVGLQEISQKIGITNARTLKDLFNVPFILEKYNAWDSLSEYRIPQGDESILNYQFQIKKEGVQYGAFLITNSKGVAETFTFNLQNSSATNVELFKVLFVPVSYFEIVPDPLIRVTKDVIINPGATCMFIFKLTGIKKGEDSSTIMISSLDRTTKINLEVKVWDLLDPKATKNLDANVWAYFNYPMVKNFEKDVEKDLLSHQINTFVIPPTRIPNFNTDNYSIFKSYLNNFPKAKNILLYLDYSDIVRRNGYPKGQFMSANWKRLFTLWYYKVKNLIQENQASPNQVYLYPYDEIKEGDINDFKKLILWAKKAMPGIKFYATLGNKKAVDEILPLVDIAQIHTSYEGINNLPIHHSKIWVYNGGTPSRGLSAYTFYRLMAWNAFVNNYSGIGFWNYADERNGNKLNLISGGNFNPAGSYSVIYNNSDGSIISSRRWEAFRLGIGDYSILQEYSKKFGSVNAKALAALVTSQPHDLNLADSIRNKMMNALFEK